MVLKLTRRVVTAFGAAAVLALVCLAAVPSVAGQSFAAPDPKRNPDDPFYLHEHLSTKSPYFPLAGPQDHTPPPPGCKAVYLNFVARHGARNPSKGEIIHLSQLQAWVGANAPALAQSNNGSLAWMLDWKNPYDLDHQQQLVELGEMQHYNISKRLARDYPEIFNVTQTQLDIYPRVFTVRATEIPRASQSAVSFAYGLFEERGDLGSMNLRSFYVYTLPRNEDKELRFFKQCPAFEIEILDNDTTYTESYKYYDANVGPVIGRVSNALGVPINKTILDAVWKACAWEFTLTGEADHWCKLLTPEDFLMFEYKDDLAFYYESGYGGRTLGYDIACPLLGEMVRLFDDKINKGTETKYERARLRFAHAETLLPLLVIMGLFNDTKPKLTSMSSPEEIRQRVYRTSQISPFAGNIMVFLYDCKDRNDGVPYRVKVAHNEKEYNISDHFHECNGELYCDYTKFKKIYDDQMFKCDFNKLCSLGNATTAPTVPGGSVPADAPTALPPTSDTPLPPVEAPVHAPTPSGVVNGPAASSVWTVPLAAGIAGGLAMLVGGSIGFVLGRFCCQGNKKRRDEYLYSPLMD